MLWHSENRSNREGGNTLVRHLYDSKAWKHFEENVDPMFKEDAWNVHFALAADGVTPFKQTRSTWSTWPMLLPNYNLLVHVEVLHHVGFINSRKAVGDNGELRCIHGAITIRASGIVGRSIGI
jgi:hypothetical protein